MSVCRFDVLLGGGGVGQEMVFEEWKEQVLRERETGRDARRSLGEEQEDVPARAHRGRCVDGLCGVVGCCVCFCAAWFGSACLLVGANVCVSVCADCAVVCCGVVGDGTGYAGTTAVRCQGVHGASHSGRRDLCLHVSSIHTFCLQPPTLVMCSTASNAFTMVRGGR